MAMEYNYWPQEEESFEESIQDELYEEQPFDESVFTPEQKVELEILCQEHNPILTRRELCIILQMNIKDRQAELEGRVPTISNSMEAHAPKEVSSSTNTSMLINDCYALIDLTGQLATLKFELLSGKYNEVSLDIDYLHTLIDHDDKLSIYEESSLLLEKSSLGDVLDIDKILNEIDNPKVEINCRDEEIVFCMVDGDEVDYFFMNSFEHEVDFVFPSNAFDPHVHLTFKDKLKMYATIVVIVFDFSFSTLPWKIVCLFAHFVSCLSRRRTKGALAQPFDTYD